MPIKPKKYDGYRSFSYLEEGKDYKPYKLSREYDRVEPFMYPVSKDEEEKVEKFMDENLVISLHEHTFVTPDDLSQIFEFRRQGRDWTGYEGLSKSGLDVVFENFMDGTAFITSNAGWKWNDVLHDLGIRYSDFAHQDLVIRAETTEDIYRAKKEGKIAF
ncbi:diguanylate cyclase, partial [Virgibacillus byunsanensis]